jgi:hypothetical protein
MSSVVSLLLNPLDVPGSLRIYDLISMPPSSLVEHARIQSEWWSAQLERQPLMLPTGMRYTFPDK